MKLKYITDKKYDIMMLNDLLGDIKDAKFFSKVTGININDSKKVFQASSSVAKKNTINKIVDKDYKKLLPYLKNFVKNYQLSWDKLNDNFFNLVYKITKQPWRYKKYYCVVSVYHQGISSWGGNKVARIWSENPDTQIRITAHEIILSHVWTILEKNKKSKDWPQNKKWEYSEVISWCLLGLDSRFDKFWPWATKSEKFPLNHNYPQLLELQKKCGKLYQKSGDFKKFLDKAIKVTKEETK